MKIRSLPLVVGALLGTLSFGGYSAEVSFDEAWQLLQQNNNSLAAQRANVERYGHLQDASGSLNLPKVTVGANYTRLDQDVTISGSQFADSLSGVPNLPAGALGPVLGQVASALGALLPPLKTKTFSPLQSERFGRFLRAVESRQLKQLLRVKKKKLKASLQWKFKLDTKI